MRPTARFISCKITKNCTIKGGLLNVCEHYLTAQLQGNVRTRLRRISHAFYTRPRLAKKGRVTHVCLVAALSRGFALVWIVSRASQTRPARVSDAFGRHLGAELYCKCVKSCYLFSSAQKKNFVFKLFII